MGKHRLRQKNEKEMPTKAEKEQYLIEATSFAATVAEEMSEPDAEKLYCPVYRVKPCGCVQRYITGGDVGDFPSEASRKRVNDLLRLHREARKLKSRITTSSNDKGDKRMLRMIRAEGFERFILANRVQVRHEMGICERACQRLLFYSNNFLHKDLKTGPEKGPRIKRMGGRKQLLKRTMKSLSEIARENCCPQRCVQFTQLRTKQIESWRKTALSNKQGVRKIVGDMLTSGLHTFCHKFIAFVTGCSFSLISKVKEQQKRKQGNSSPPQQYKVKKTWSEEPKKKYKNVDLHVPYNGMNGQSCSEEGMHVAEQQSVYDAVPQHHSIDIASQSHAQLHIPQPSNSHLHIPQTSSPHLHIPQPSTMSTLHTSLQDVNFQLDHSAFSHYLQSRAEFWQPLGMDCPSQTLQAITPSRVVNVTESGDSPPQSQTLTVLSPAATSSSNYAANHPHSSVIFSVPESLHGQAISVISSQSSLEPLNSSPFGNVVIFPESTIYVPNHHSVTGIL